MTDGAGLMTASRHVVITGCSGGGKSTLLAELARRGHAVVDAAVQDYARLCRVYPALGYAASDVPRDSVQARADFILSALRA